MKHGTIEKITGIPLRTLLGLDVKPEYVFPVTSKKKATLELPENHKKGE